MKLLSRGEDRTRELAARVGRRARPGDAVLLFGPLGSGKTVFAQGFARGAGFRGRVQSPTFSIARRLRGRGRVLHHLDLYRVAAPELPQLGLEDCLEDAAGLCLIEWPEILGPLAPPDRLEVRFSHVPQGRRLELRASGPRGRRLLEALR